MKKIVCGILLGAAVLPALADQYVDGYFRKDGAYVPPYYRSAPNSTRLDNYSTQGNINPYTAIPGAVPAYPQYPQYPQRLPQSGWR